MENHSSYRPIKKFNHLHKNPCKHLCLCVCTCICQRLYDNKLKPSGIYSRNSRLVRTQNVFNLEYHEINLKRRKVIRLFQ